ncbi:MAG TPA: UMP kinase [Candidatus Nanoarchaeia archaeon]|nr:UMP kinase [Candidatus Nanoarchaeia archaeon]
MKRKKRVVVLSLGGSQIIPDDVNYSYLKKFKRVLEKHKKDYNFVVVCGGGSLARKYIKAIKKEGLSEFHQSLAGISATRSNARFVSHFFGFDSMHGVPHTVKTVGKYLKKQGIVFCGALEYKEDQTSDSVAAILAKRFGGEFVNLTNVKGLYTKDPNKYKNAKFISEISWKDFDEMVQKIKFKPGQHFVLDQNASKVIRKKKIPTHIIKDLSQLDKYLSWQKFVGTTIEG